MPLEKDLTRDDRWEFDEAVADGFGEMLERSIPDYDRMRALVFEVGRRFVTPPTAIVDLGTSRGDAIVPFVTEFAGDAVVFYAYETSAPMLAAASARFEGCRNVFVLEHDLRNPLPPLDAPRPSLFLSILTLQFVPINYRLGLLSSARARLAEDGALILVEKVLGSSAATDELLVANYHATKERAGYSRDEIERKKLALEGVLVPVTAAWNEDMLRIAGFRSIECFWRNLNFAGWVALP